MEKIKLTVTQITSYLWSKEGPFNDVPYITVGSLFHQICNDLIKKLEDDESFWRTQSKLIPSQVGPEAKLDIINGPMRDYVYHEIIQKERKTKFNKLKPESQLALWNAVKHFLEELIYIFSAAKTQKRSIHEIMLGAEQSLSWRVQIDNRIIEVTGRYDLLFYDPRYDQPHLIDFKLCGIQKDLAGLTQVMLYSLMLNEKHKIQPGATLLNLYPEPRRIIIAWNEIAAFRNPLITLIQEVAAKEYPTRIEPPDISAEEQFTKIISEVIKPEIGSADSASATDHKNNFATAEELESAFDNLQMIQKKLGEFNCPVEAYTAGDGPIIIGPRYRIIRVVPGRGVKVASLVTRAQDLEVAMSLEDTPRIVEGPGFVSVEIPRATPAIVNLEDLDLSSKPTTSSFILGVDIAGVPKWGDLAKSDACHILAGGQTGSGKSEFIRQLVCSLVSGADPTELQLLIIDPKMTDYQDLNGSPFLSKPVIYQMEEAVDILDEMVNEMQKRYGSFKNRRVNSLCAFNDLDNIERIPRVLVVFDEFADAMADSSLKKLLESSIKRLGGKSRAAGIHLLIATQSPRKEAVTGLIKANLPCAVALRTANGVESKIIIDCVGAEKLLGNGDLLAKKGGRLERLQSPYASSDVMRRFMKL